jgi:metal transporter CNNM
VPQGICTRYGLAVGYYASWLVRILMIAAWPVAWPLGKVLDVVLGHSPTALPRGQLVQYMTLHGEDEGYARLGQALTRNETHVINSALELTSKTARRALTPIDKVFMVPSDATLDEALCAKMIEMGHSRIPVHAPGDRTSIIGQLLVKELLLVKV